MLLKTKIKRALAIVALSALVTAHLGSTFAATQIGTGSVTGSGAFDAAIMWDETFTSGSASGSISGIKVKARVEPTLSMEVSTGCIDLGTLVSGVTSTGSLFIEIGTNAKFGVSITARSGSAGLTNTSSGAIKIQDNQDVFDDLIDESFTYSSTPNGTDDSASPAFSASGLTELEVNDNTTEHTVYNTNKAEATNLVDDVEFIVGATTVAETPAGDYEDTVTFTVTGNF